MPRRRILSVLVAFVASLAAALAWPAAAGGQPEDRPTVLPPIADQQITMQFKKFAVEENRWVAHVVLTNGTASTLRPMVFELSNIAARTVFVDDQGAHWHFAAREIPVVTPPRDTIELAPGKAVEATIRLGSWWRLEHVPQTLMGNVAPKPSDQLAYLVRSTIVRPEGGDLRRLIVAGTGSCEVSWVEK